MTNKQKQCLLTYLGYDTGGVDGIWGNKSRQAVECAQEDLGIPADGVWGPQTETAVLEAVYTYDVDAPVQQEPEMGDPELAARFKGIRYWSPEEFRCQCYGKYCNGFPALPNRTLLELVDDLRHKAGAPGHRSSGLRCQIHNDLQPGSVPDSRHRTGKAFDFMLENKTGQQLLAMAQADPRCRYAYIIGNGPYVHVDVN
ncbi:MAG: peptidoglycan-binding protein [Oscillospiraceae bacterium]|nr:peptidoglycan-binding protein [Oscillospiraceae bacterium]